MSLSWMAVLLVLLVGCGTTSRVVRLDSGQGRPTIHTMRGGQEPVKLREDELREKMPELVRDVRPSSQPLRFARSLMFESWQEDVCLEWTGRSLVPSTPEAPRLLAEQDEFTRGYGRWCERRGRSRDCFSLLKDTPTLDADGRYTLAMAIATDAVWNETKAAFAEMADPEQVRATIVSSMAMYMMLWVLPEPVSKGLAATLTVWLIAYLGVDTVWGLMGGWIELVEEVNRATTFEQLREAGERYGKVMGRHAARAFVLLATAAIGSTAGLGPKGPGLPGYSRAAVLAETQGGFQLAAVGEPPKAPSPSPWLRARSPCQLRGRGLAMAQAPTATLPRLAAQARQIPGPIGQALGGPNSDSTPVTATTDLTRAQTASARASVAQD